MVGLTGLLKSENCKGILFYRKRAEKRFAQINSAYAEVGLSKGTLIKQTLQQDFVNGLIYAASRTYGCYGAVGAWKFVGAMSVGKAFEFSCIFKSVHKAIQ